MLEVRTVLLSSGFLLWCNLRHTLVPEEMSPFLGEFEEYTTTDCTIEGKIFKNANAFEGG